MLIYLPLTIIITLSELSASPKPVTDTEQICSPLSLLSNGENVIILVYCSPSLTVILILDDGDVKSRLSQLTITSDDDTPSTTVTVQVRM